MMRGGVTSFTMLNDKVLKDSEVITGSITNNKNGVQFYKEAYEFREKALNQYKLGDLKTSDAVDEKGEVYTETTTPYQWNQKIFNGTFEDKNSNFNTHKTEVIKHVVETNLGTAIEQFNNVSTVSTKFAMPKLQDYEWETISNNVSMITFLQGLDIGGKVYSGHAIVQNTLTEDFVSEDSIYILSNDGQYRRVTDPDLINGTVNLDNNTIGLFNTDFERRVAVAVDPKEETHHKNIYYYPREDMASYKSIINLNFGTNGSSDDETPIEAINEYFKGVTPGTPKYQLAQIYYTALGRERYGMYRVNSDTRQVAINAGLKENP